MMNYPKLKPAVKAKWLKALRSGEYKKGMNQLCIVPLNEGGEYSFCWTDDKGFAPKAWTHARIADWVEANL
jgi:hypothetical protein